MNRHHPHQKNGLLLGIALCSLLFPALVAAGSPDPQDAGTASAQEPGQEDEGLAASRGDPAASGQSPPAPASRLHQDDSHWRLRFNLAFVEPMGNSVSTSNWRGDVSFDMGVGVSLQAEYRVSPRIGVEIGVMGASGFGLSSSVSHGNVSGDIRLTGFAPLSLGLNVHLTPESTVDLYAGPQLALVAYGTNRTWWDSWSGGVELSAKNDWAWGLVAGLDVPLGKRGWLFNANLRYLDTSIEQSGGGFHFDGDFDPLIFSLGFGYAF